ncbi:alpha-ketoglutarate-dependent dioxygenase AlkB [Flavobacteriales bacterium]|jgi:alkylated DNA repair dioxygenase AlkB|nr:alpha-ketoglutarate-dependent dioxygenase AlkB [Flavobacteriales bacterium]
MAELWPQARRVVLEEDLHGKQASCWIQPSAFEHLDLATWWDWVGEAGAGWSQNDIRVFGKWHKEPRLTAWWGPAYAYASVQWPARPLEGAIADLAAKVGEAAGFDFNAVLVNGYRDGQDAMGWHRDNEPEIDTSCIASLSLGAGRTFKVRDRRTKEVVNLELGHGDLLVMEHLQEEHEHSVPKRARVHEPRLNFTFRRLV